MNLAPLPVAKAPSGVDTYNRHQNCLPSVFDKGHTQHCSGPSSHPALNGAMGCLPGDRYGVDRTIMNNTLHETLKVWEWGNCTRNLRSALPLQLQFEVRCVCRLGLGPADGCDDSDTARAAAGCHRHVAHEQFHEHLPTHRCETAFLSQLISRVLLQ